jgi:NADPH:quinone reductase-like Zn-dependent oxidoreductase
MSRDMNIELVRIIEEHGIRPVIARTFEWDKAKEAFKMLLDQTEVGKIVIKV